MEIDEFKRLLAAKTPPSGASKVLQALWHDAKGEWSRAHAIVQSVESTAGARVHAYLHRKEGDRENANYWYDRAGMKMPKVTLEAEWSVLVMALLRGRPKRHGPQIKKR